VPSRRGAVQGRKAELGMGDECLQPGSRHRFCRASSCLVQSAVHLGAPVVHQQGGWMRRGKAQSFKRRLNYSI
jgi:hypothetical protein